MRRITIQPPKFPSPGTNIYKPPECREIRLSEGVATIMATITGYGGLEGSYTPEGIVLRLNINFEVYKHRMASVGLSEQDFIDLIVTLRKMAQYAVDIEGMISYERMKEGEENVNPNDDPEPDD